MEVLIVSKTYMASAFCVGGLVLENDRYVRLLNKGGVNQPLWAEPGFQIGDIWDVDFDDSPILHPPHIEDVIISNKTFIRRIDDIPGFLNLRQVIDWRGHIDNLFDGLLDWTSSGTGYIPAGENLPTKSVGFWIPDRDLFSRVFSESKIKYRYPADTNYRSITYVGTQETVVKIPAGTIIRVSLSRLFPSEDSKLNLPRGYYLQLSGWYL